MINFVAVVEENKIGICTHAYEITVYSLYLGSKKIIDQQISLGTL